MQEPTSPFREPWQAQAFATVVTLHQAGHFTWAEWTETLGAEISTARADGDADTGETYYRHWLAALERLIREKALATDSELATRRIQLAATASQHAHHARRDPLAVTPARTRGT